jgi:hypothetical protein
MLTHAVAPSPSSDWQNVFEKNVSKRNPDGTPIEGSIVVHFGITKDIRTLTEGNLHVNIFNATDEEGMTMYKVKQPKDMYELLCSGLIIALKKGKSLYAWAEITKSYYYVQCPKWAHRWDYKILRLANDAESERHEGWMKTFHMNAIEVPADVHKIQALNNLRQSILDHREKKSILYTKMLEATVAFQAAEGELNSLERTLELSELM